MVLLVEKTNALFMYLQIGKLFSQPLLRTNLHLSIPENDQIPRIYRKRNTHCMICVLTGLSMRVKFCSVISVISYANYSVISYANYSEIRE